MASAEDELRCVVQGVERAIREALRCPNAHCGSCRDLLADMSEMIRGCLGRDDLPAALGAEAAARDPERRR